ncbi:MAG: DUF5131 family protein, partial [Nitrososphaerales archaeon]
YAERLAKRLKLMGNPKYSNGFTFTVQENALEVPFKWKQPRKIFVNSMSDLFHEFMPDDYLQRCFDVMERANWHIYQILTKRPERMLEFARTYGKIPDHIWLGTSCEMRLYTPRVDILRKIDAKVRFISFEPLIGPIGKVNLSGISWAIVGGESGPGHRPIKVEWVREIRDQCVENGVAFFFKQWGGIRPTSGGRRLDGRYWNQYPYNCRNSSGQKLKDSEIVISTRVRN